MSDFTKNELQIILLEMNISINRYGGILKVADSYIDLRDKVESMIDNYCDHEYDNESYTIVSIEYFNPNQGYETHKERKAMCCKCKKWIVLQ